MKITLDFLKEKSACQSGVDWCVENNLIGLETPDFLHGLAKGSNYQWANWLIVRVMTRPQYLAYAIFAAEQVIDSYEKKYPDNKRPREAIEAAKKVLENDTEKNRAAAADAYADAAYADDAAAAAAAYAAAAYTDATAAYAADAAATYAADAYAADARKEMQERILNYGIGLLE